MTSEDRLTRLERIVEKRVQAALGTDERMDELRAAQANSEAKMAALTDAHTHLADRMGELTAKMTDLAAAHARLADSQAQTYARLDALINTVRAQREGKPPGSLEEGDAGV